MDKHEDTPRYHDEDVIMARRDLANTIAQQAEALASGTFIGVESAHVDRLLANAQMLRAWTPTV